MYFTGCAGVKTEQKKMGTLLFCSQQRNENKHTQQHHTGTRENNDAAGKIWILFDEQS